MFQTLVEQVEHNFAATCWAGTFQEIILFVQSATSLAGVENYNFPVQQSILVVYTGVDVWQAQSCATLVPIRKVRVINQSTNVSTVSLVTPHQY